MAYETTTLRSGLRVICLKASSPVVYCGYGIAAGTRDEASSEEGLAHFCEHTTFKGTSRRSSMKILNALERVGGDLNAFTSKEDTIYCAAILKDHIAKAVDLLTDIVFHSTYPEAEVLKEIEVICDEIESYNDSPSELIYDEFERIIFSGHPLGHNILGSAKKVREYSSKDAIKFTSKHYRADNAIFFAYGDVSIDTLAHLLEKATSDLPLGEPHIGKKSRTLIPKYQPQNLSIHKDTHQAHVMIGRRAYSVHEKKRIALYLLNNIMGGPGLNARLNVVLREKNALVYSVDSSMVNYSDTGAWCTYFGCDKHDIPQCLHLVKTELEKVMRNPLSLRQLSQAKRQIKGQIAIACDNRESFALDFAKSFLHYDWKRDINALIQDIDKLQVEDIHRVACEIFSFDNLSSLIYY